APQPPHGVVESDEQYAEENETVENLLEEESGIRGRLSSLIGRDLGDGQDDAAARIDPPMASAPMPRIEPADRALHGGSAIDQSVQQLQDAVPTASRQPSPAMTGGLDGEGLHKLRAVVHDQWPCKMPWPFGGGIWGSSHGLYCLRSRLSQVRWRLRTGKRRSLPIFPIFPIFRRHRRPLAGGRRSHR